MEPKIILVTGANRGIGREVAKILALQGHHVIATARDPKEQHVVFPEVGQEILIKKLDIRNTTDIQSLVSFIESTFGRLDVLVNNAAIMDKNLLSQPDIKSIRNVMNTNFYGPLELTAAMLPQIKKSKGGRIINVSSEMGAFSSLAGGGNAGYRLSKAGINAQTRILSGELATDGIAVNAVCPGWVRTDMGGRRAPRSVAKGAETIVWLATGEEIPTGKFFRDKHSIPW